MDELIQARRVNQKLTRRKENHLMGCEVFVDSKKKVKDVETQERYKELISFFV